ncbi:MAG: repair protein [Alphaproteobacteria bacterium]|nr:repair protein [Alphaproteobacteria bacterium]
MPRLRGRASARPSAGVPGGADGSGPDPGQAPGTRVHSPGARMTAPPIFTVGHSTRTIPEFVDLLRAGAVALVVDIRTVPRSRRNPHYNLDELADALAPWQIGHLRIEELGGLRGRSSDVPPQVNGYWTNQSFHNYADYALSDDYREGLAQLQDVSSERRTAIMCAESVWWRCHRRIVADYLIDSGREVFHLMGDSRVNPATMTPGAQRHPDGLHYPAAG